MMPAMMPAMMMVASPTARWLLTAAFAVAALAAAVPAFRRRADWVAAGSCVAMCAALIAMTWVPGPEPAAAVWPQVAGFGAAGLWFALARRPWPDRLYHVLMAAVMIWMLTAMSAPSMSGLVRAVSGLVAASCIAAALPWVVRPWVVRPWLERAAGTRLAGSGAAAGNAVMSAGMAAMVLAML